MENFESHAIDEHGGPTRRVLPAVSLILVLHFLLVFLSDSIPSHKVLFLFFFAILILMPGYLLSMVIFPGARIYCRIFLSLIMGTAAISVLLILFDILGLDIYYLAFILPVLSLFVAIFKDYSSFSGYRFPENQPLSIPILIIAVLITVYVSIVTIGVGDPFLFTGDSLDHVAYIRTINRSHEVFPDEFLYKNGGILTRDIRKGLFHAIWGTVNLPSGRIQIHNVWPLITCISSLFLLLAIFCLGVQFFRNQSIAITGVILYLLIYRGGQSAHQMIMNGYPFYFGKVFLYGSLMLVPLFFRTGRKELLILIVLSSFSAVSTHVVYIMIILFGIAIFAAFEWFQSPKQLRRTLLRREIPLVSAAVFAVNLPYLLIRYFRDYNPLNEIHTHVHGLLHITDKLAVVNPINFFIANGYLMAVSFFAIFILWRSSRDEKNLRLLLGSTAAVYVLVFNPLWVKFIMDRIAYLIVRFAVIVPTMLITAYLLRSLWLKLWRKTDQISPVAAAAGWLVIAGLLLQPLISNFSEFIYIGEEREAVERRSALVLSDLYSEIDRSIPPGNVIASDPLTSYSIPAFCDQYVICTFDQHSIPNDSTALERIMDCRDIYLPSIPCREVINTVREYGAGYVIINGRIPESIMGDYWQPDSDIAEAAFHKLLGCEESLKLIYRSESVSIFKYKETGKRPGEGETIPLEFSDGTLRGKYNGHYDELTHAETEGVYIKNWGKDMDSVERGDTLTIFVDWVSEHKLPPGNYTVHVRFDTGYEKGPLFSSIYEKVYRKIREKIIGERFRFRVSSLTFDGLYPPDKWTPGRILREYLEIPVPVNISKGMYTISVKMDRAPHIANYRIRDILTDDDVYDGPDLMKVFIE